MNAEPQPYRFPNVSCSNCGRSFGPGNHGHGHCDQHRHRDNDPRPYAVCCQIPFYGRQDYINHRLNDWQHAQERHMNAEGYR